MSDLADELYGKKYPKDSSPRTYRVTVRIDETKASWEKKVAVFPNDPELGERLDAVWEQVRAAVIK